MVSQSFQLVMRVGPSPGKVFALTANEIILGRDIDNEIVINDAEISRRHTRMLIQEGGYVIEDLGSTNGTFVNGKKITGSHVLQPGQTIRLGENVTLSYEIAGFDPDATIASGQRQPAASAARPAKPAAPVQRAPDMQAPASPGRFAAQGGLANLTSNRNLMIGCGALLVIGVCAFSIFLYIAPRVVLLRLSRISVFWLLLTDYWRDQTLFLNSKRSSTNSGPPASAITRADLSLIWICWGRYPRSSSIWVMAK